LGRSTNYTLGQEELIKSTRVGRSLAILLVVIGHLHLAVSEFHFVNYFSGAKIGVALFTFYSGLLLQYQYERRACGFKINTWIVKRLSKIYPIYWLGLLLCIMIGYIINKEGFSFETIVWNILGLHLYVGLFRDIQVISSGFMTSPYWYVSFIIGCYLIFIILKDFSYKGHLAIGSIIILPVLFVYWFSGDHIILALTALPMFLLGMWKGQQLAAGKKIYTNNNICLMLIVVCLSFSAVGYKLPFMIDSMYIRMALRVLGCIGLNSGSYFIFILLGHLYNILINKHPTLLKWAEIPGNISYEIYCFHEPLMFFLVTLTSNGYLWMGLVVYMLAITFFSYYIQYLIKNIKIVSTS